MIKEQRFAHTTEDELRYLQGLGGWTESGVSYKYKRHHQALDPGRRLDLLKKYRESIPKRKNWGEINVGAILAYLNLAVREQSSRDLGISDPEITRDQ